MTKFLLLFHSLKTKIKHRRSEQERFDSKSKNEYYTYTTFSQCIFIIFEDDSIERFIITAKISNTVDVDIENLFFVNSETNPRFDKNKIRSIL